MEMKKNTDKVEVEKCPPKKTVVGYVFSRELVALANQLPEVRGRALLVHQLIGAYDLLPCLRQIEPIPATDAELRHFHSQEYIHLLRQLVEQFGEEGGSEDETDQVNPQVDNEKCEQFGLAYDCPPFPRLHRTVAYLAGASTSAARALAEGKCTIALNWFGGWHHGRRDEASGFCYTNDIVFAILTLLEEGFKRVLYLDLDLHHGNGVQDAFERSEKVVTLSVHKHEVGFFPGTGALEEVGVGCKGRYHCLNLPLADGADDATFTSALEAILSKLMPRFRPEVLVVQCGADGLSGDRRCASFNLTLEGYETVIGRLLELHGKERPVLLLGGGGYHFPNTARLWTALTALCVDRSLDDSIPEHEQWLEYGPSYELPITASSRPNRNSSDSVAASLEAIIRNIEQINVPAAAALDAD